jgi:hypothetical protein
MTLNCQHLARALYDAEWADADIRQPWENASPSARARYLRLADVALRYTEAARLDERRLWQARTEAAV